MRRSEAARERYGISLRELRVIVSVARKARMTMDPHERELARIACERGAAELMRLARMVVNPTVIGVRMPSSRESKCSMCGAPIGIGDEIVWLPKTPVCIRCVDPKERAA